ncbi:hypothetical protein [Roseivirga sp.]|uniref:hypothetical protein n=1 Tax=Roseivirga sp. TaxID=1964215 RepID=UPI003B524A25
MKKTLFIILLISSTLLSCTKSLDLGDFDAEKWKSDPEGCQNIRPEMVDDLRELKPKLLGLYQKSVIKALGQPEREELYERSQTYYIYSIDPSEKCDNQVNTEPRELRIRFTALGIANEVNIR